MVRPLLLTLGLLGCGTSAEEPPGPVVTAGGDRDMDGIADAVEGDLDPDGDGLGNADDPDSDGDGIADAVEGAELDSDGDGVPDRLDLDSDGNGVGDDVEGASDTDRDGDLDYRDLDDDADGVADRDEVDGALGRDLSTDDDALVDRRDVDSDGDGILDGVEARGDAPVDTDGDGTPDLRDLDSDDDGLTDADEARLDPAHQPEDADDDGVPNYLDLDSDGDSLLDHDERGLRTDPYSADTDGDGYSDPVELAGGSDPTDGLSVLDAVEVEVPADGAEHVETVALTIGEPVIDLAIVTDTTCSMSSVVSALAAQAGELYDELVDIEGIDLNVAVVTFDDYAYGSMGSSPDKPFHLAQQATDDRELVRDAYAAMEIHNGADGAESVCEALYQTFQGVGFDQDLDGRYDASTDVLPFIASTSDAFGGGAPDTYDATDPSTGTLGGVGFREGALPVVAYFTDNTFRDPDEGDPVPNATAAGCGDAADAANDLGAVLVGVMANGLVPEADMTDLAYETGSLADLDGVDQPLVFEWWGSWTDAALELREALVVHALAARDTAVGRGVELAFVGSTYGVLSTYEVADTAGASIGDEVEATLRLQVPEGTAPGWYPLEAELGSGNMVVSRRTIIVHVVE